VGATMTQDWRAGESYLAKGTDKKTPPPTEPHE